MMTWKEIQLSKIAEFKDEAEKWGVEGDNMLTLLYMENVEEADKRFVALKYKVIKEALESLDDEPAPYVKSAVERSIYKDERFMKRVTEWFREREHGADKPI